MKLQWVPFVMYEKLPPSPDDKDSFGIGSLDNYNKQPPLRLWQRDNDSNRSECPKDKNIPVSIPQPLKTKMQFDTISCKAQKYCWFEPCSNFELTLQQKVGFCATVAWKYRTTKTQKWILCTWQTVTKLVRTVCLESSHTVVMPRGKKRSGVTFLVVQIVYPDTYKSFVKSKRNTSMILLHPTKNFMMSGTMWHVKTEFSFVISHCETLILSTTFTASLLRTYSMDSMLILNFWQYLW